MRFWRSAAVIWGGVTAVGIVVAFALPAVYESAAIVEVHAALPRAVAPAAVEQTVRALSSDTTLLTALARYGDGSDESLDQALERTRSAVAISVQPDGAFRVAFSAPGPESAQRGCRDLTEALTRGLSSPDAASGPELKKKQAELEQRTQELTLFVATHPEVMGQAEPARREAAGPRVDAHATDANDPTLLVLRQEKKRLEAELGSRAAAPTPSSVFGPNPYDEPPSGADTATIQRRLGELRLAIFAHQRALAAQAGATDTGKAAPRTTDPALTAEWRKLVQAVIDAQKGVSVVAPPAFEARVVEAPSLPPGPTKPNRPLLTTLATLAGMWSSLLWALFRSKRSDSRKRAQAARATKTLRIDGLAAPALTDGAGEAPTKQLAEPARDADPAAPGAVAGRSDPPGAARTPSDAPAAPGAPIVPNAMVSPRTTDTAERRSSSPAAFTKTLVAGSGSGLSPIPPAPARPGSDPGRSSSKPPRPDPNRSRSSNPPPLRGTATTAASDRRTVTGPAPAPRRDPPPRPSSELPHAARSTLRPPPKAPSDPPPKPPPEASQPPPRAEGRQSVPPPRRTISPPPMAASAVPAHHGDSAPDTRRIGSPEPSPLRASSMPHVSSPPTERPDTTYSIVDKSRRPSSRTPAPAPERRLSDRGTRPLTTDPTGVLKPLAEEPHAHSPSDRPHRSVRSDTRPGWAIPGSSPTAARGEIVKPSSAPPPARDEGVVRPLSVPPSWRPPPLQQAPESEITQLRDQILAQRNGQCFVVGITSDPDSLANKSALAMRLAMLLSETPARVLIMEANFDFPAVHRVLGIDMPRLAGFSQQIHARIRSGEQVPWKVVRCSTNLDVLGEGFMRSPGVSFSREFSEAVAELRRGYDFIVADGPTASAGADCKPLNSLADGLVVAVHPGAKLADAMERAARWFTRKELMAAVFVDVK